jgi:tetratricopeptide (TPR) repeat protein
VPIDREATLKKAEKLLRQGKLDGAIAEYVRLVEDQPRDFNAINALGDLYVRAGNADRAVAQFTRVADQLFTEGFLQRAQALYKKALKTQPQHDHTLSQLADIASRQGLTADAKTYLRQLLERRRQQGDERGVADCFERMRALDEATSDASARSQNAAARAPSAEPAADDADALLASARREQTSGNELQARALLTRVLTLDPGRHGDVVGIALELAQAGRIESAFGCIDVAADAALLGGEWKRAIETLQTFVRAAPHIPALIKLVELCVDAGSEGPLRAAQAQLADAYLDTGKGHEARVIAEDLLDQDPECEAHAQRLRHAITLIGGEDGDRVVADVRSRHRAPDSDGDQVSFGETAVREPSLEIDLSEVLASIPSPEKRGNADPYARATGHLEAGRIDQAIADLREAAAAPHTRARAAAELGRLYVRRGDLPAAVEWFERAADGPAETEEAGFAVLYDLADALERLGEPTRALAVLIDLDADSGGYRDVRARIDQLARTQTGSSRE